MSETTFPVYVGWIYGDPEDRATKRLGVKGEMIWRASSNPGSVTVAAPTKRGIFEHCECTGEVLDWLEKEYLAFYRGSFTETDERAYRKYRRQFEEATDGQDTD